ncbi:TetR/AcrR family transcriptional regulator [Halobellus captivus]|uniref:TetR/AcrR family transcriptional regulator n=1 Tax=Halobellus captivus TaxID=2592614 RepID=UPI001EF006FE|nr:TetR family transcriptional regulator C-terminal domain-containing protein [Halobellus captivus]
MSTAISFLESPTDTREEIMRATYLALCEHGYVDLTIQRIGEAFPKSKSLIYHHYESKDELLLDLLEFVLERFEETISADDPDSPAERLRAVLDHALATSLRTDRREFIAAMVELRAQATHDDRYRDHFTRHDRFFRDRLASIVADGVDAGTFAAVDEAAVASFLLSTIVGTMTRRVTSDEIDVEPLRAQVDTYVEALFVENR